MEAPLLSPRLRALSSALIQKSLPISRSDPTLDLREGREFWSSTPNRIEVFLAGVLTVDVFVAICASLAGSPVLRVSRPLRLMPLPLWNAPLYNVVQSTYQTLPSLQSLMLMLLGCLLVFALLGTSLYGDEDTSTRVLGRDNFRDFGGAALTLLVLFTGADNLPQVVQVQMGSNVWSVVFFVAFIVLVLFIIMPVLVAVVFDGYKRSHSFSVLQAKVKERYCLFAAFMMYDVESNHLLSYLELGHIVGLIRKGATKTEMSAFFATLDTNGSKTIDQAEFVHMCDVLVLRMRQDGGWRLLPQCPCLHWSLPSVSRLVQHPAFSWVVNIAIVANIVFLIAGAAVLPGEALYVVDTGFVAVFTAEAALKVVGFSPEGYWEERWNRFDLLLVAVGWLLAIVSGSGSALTALRSGRVLRLLKVVRVAKSFTLFTHVHSLKVLIRTFAQTAGMFVTLWSGMAIFMYAMAIVATEAFAGVLWWEGSGPNECAPWCGSFDSLPLSLLALFHMLTGAGWSVLMYRTMELMQTYWVCVYFIGYVFGAHLLFLQLLGALVLEVYSVEHMKAEEKEDEGVLAQLGLQQTDYMSTSGQQRDIETVGLAGIHQLTKKLEDLFHEHDIDGGGFLQPNELRTLLRALDFEPSDELVQEVLKYDPELDGVDLVEMRLWFQQWHIKQLFAKYDKDHSGTMSLSELGMLMQDLKLDLSEEELGRVMEDLDRNHDGSLGFVEYMRWWLEFECRTAFQQFDTDNSGSISRDELRQVLTNMGLNFTGRQFHKLAVLLDTDHNGMISYEEFLPWWWTQLDRNGEFDSQAVSRHYLQQEVEGKALRVSQTSWEDSLFYQKDTVVAGIRKELFTWTLCHYAVMPAHTPEQMLQTYLSSQDAEYAGAWRDHHKKKQERRTARNSKLPSIKGRKSQDGNVGRDKDPPSSLMSTTPLQQQVQPCS